MDLSKVDENELSNNLTFMNNWSRKSSPIKTPNEVMFGVYLTLGVSLDLTNYL